MVDPAQDQPDRAAPTPPPPASQPVRKREEHEQSGIIPGEIPGRPSDPRDPRFPGSQPDFA